MSDNILIDSYDSALEYVSEHSTVDIDPMNLHPDTDTYLCEFAGAFTGAVVGSTIRKIKNVFSNTEDKIIEKIPDGHIIQNTELLPKETIKNINTRLIERAYNNIKKFNSECKEIITGTNKSILCMDNNQNESNIIKKEYEKYMLENPITIDKQFEKYLNVMTEKSPEFFTGNYDVSYNKKHNIPQTPKMIQYEWLGKIEGDGKIGNFIMKIPVVAMSFSFGSCGSGSGGCSIL